MLLPAGTASFASLAPGRPDEPGERGCFTGARGSESFPVEPVELGVEDDDVAAGMWCSVRPSARSGGGRGGDEGLVPVA